MFSQSYEAAEIRSPLRHTALHKITASQFTRKRVTLSDTGKSSATYLILSDSVHYIEDVFMLAADHYADLISKGFQFFCKNSIIFLTFAGILYYLYFRRALQKITVQRL